MGNITWLGADYVGVPFVSFPQTGGGEVTFYENGGSPSATKHTIHLEFSDSTDEDIDVYYDDALLGTMITTYTPTTVDGKTVASAQLDGVEWYNRFAFMVLYEGVPQFYTDAGNYLWIPELGNVQPVVGSVWRITIDGTAYICTAQNSSVGVIIGNPIHVGGADDGSGVPVAFYNYNNQAWSGDTTTLTQGDHTVKIERQGTA